MALVSVTIKEVKCVMFVMFVIFNLLIFSRQVLSVPLPFGQYQNQHLGDQPTPGFATPQPPMVQAFWESEEDSYLQPPLVQSNYIVPERPEYNPYNSRRHHKYQQVYRQPEAQSNGPQPQFRQQQFYEAPAVPSPEPVNQFAPNYHQNAHHQRYQASPSAYASYEQQQRRPVAPQYYDRQQQQQQQLPETDHFYSNIHNQFNNEPIYQQPPEYVTNNNNGFNKNLNYNNKYSTAGQPSDFQQPNYYNNYGASTNLDLDSRQPSQNYQRNVPQHNSQQKREAYFDYQPLYYQIPQPNEYNSIEKQRSYPEYNNNNNQIQYQANHHHAHHHHPPSSQAPLVFSPRNNPSGSQEIPYNVQMPVVVHQSQQQQQQTQQRVELKQEEQMINQIRMPIKMKILDGASSSSSSSTPPSDSTTHAVSASKYNGNQISEINIIYPIALGSRNNSGNNIGGTGSKMSTAILVIELDYSEAPETLETTLETDETETNEIEKEKD